MRVGVEVGVGVRVGVGVGVGVGVEVGVGVGVRVGVGVGGEVAVRVAIGKEVGVVAATGVEQREGRAAGVGVVAEVVAVALVIGIRVEALGALSESVGIEAMPVPAAAMAELKFTVAIAKRE